MHAKDIMTAPVITITPDSPVHEIAALLLERRISGVPGRETARSSAWSTKATCCIGTRSAPRAKTPERSWWARLIEHDQFPSDYVKSHARKARDIMSQHVVSVTEDAPARRLASIFAARHVRRIPVLRGKQLGSR